MEKGNFNVIIFDDDEPPSRDKRPNNPSKNSSNTPQYDIIEQEIKYLSQKIKNLQQQTEGLGLFRNDSNCTQKNSMTTIEGGSVTKDILMAIEKKIQIVVKETRKIVDRLGESFQKKLEGRLNKKYDELGVAKIKEGYAASIKKIEEHYKKEVQRINREHKEAEVRMTNKVTQIQQHFLNRLNQFDLKEKEYIAWIHHLEIQLKEKGSKKMIEITQERASRKDTSEASILSSNLENQFSSINQPNNPPNNRISPAPNDTSKIQRKHRIFDNANKGSSVSPNNKLPQSVPNPIPAPALFQSTKVVNPAIRTKPFGEASELEQPVTVSLATRATQPIRNVFGNDSESSPWRIIDKDSGKRTGEASQRNKVSENVREDEFYKDVPKPNSGWQKFQDFKDIDDGSSDSDEDVLFYRQGDQHQEFMDNFRSTKFKGEESKDPRRMQQSKKERFNPVQEKVFSPFDLS